MIETNSAPANGRPIVPLSAREASDLLAEAGTLLASSLDYETTLQAVADLAVQRLADYCLVDVAEQVADPRRLAIAHADPKRRSVLRAAALAYPPDLRTGTPFMRILDGNVAQRFDATDAWLQQVTGGDPDYLEFMRVLAPRQFLMVPLRARDHTLGSFWLCATRDRGGSDFVDAELALARELGRLAALHIDNARLYEKARRALALRDEVMGVVAHDLRNPVGTIRMASDLLLDPQFATTPALISKQAAAIRRQADAMNRLIGDLLDVTRIEAGRMNVDMRPVGSAVLVDDAFEALGSLADRAQITLRRVTPAGLPDVLADRDRLAQVFSNLVGNALKFTPTGESVTLSAEVGEGGAHGAANTVYFAVADTGPGISPEQLPRLWDRFWQADRSDRRGAGLGLAIVKGIVEAHGGEIRAESELGRGTTFRFGLPVAPVRMT